MKAAKQDPFESVSRAQQIGRKSVSHAKLVNQSKTGKPCIWRCCPHPTYKLLAMPSAWGARKLAPLTYSTASACWGCCPQTPFLHNNLSYLQYSIYGIYSIASTVFTVSHLWYLQSWYMQYLVNKSGTGHSQAHSPYLQHRPKLAGVLPPNPCFYCNTFT